MKPISYKRNEMREILFRAKRKVKDVWVTGSYIYKVYHDIKGDPYTDDNGKLLDEYMMLSPERIDATVIIRETLGQFTGKVAKGKKIFEADIVRYKNKVMVVEWNENNAMFSLRCLDGSNDMLSFSEILQEEIDVIGNVYDNPEWMISVRGNND